MSDYLNAVPLQNGPQGPQVAAIPMPQQQTTPQPPVPQAPVPTPLPPGYPAPGVIPQDQMRQLPQPNPSPVEQRPSYVPEENAFGRTAQHRAAKNAFLSNTTNQINYYVKQAEEKRIRNAQSDWTRLQTAISTGDTQTINDILSDPKKLKSMAKALNMDFLNPDKGANDPYRKGLLKTLSSGGQAQQQGQAQPQQPAQPPQKTQPQTQPQTGNGLSPMAQQMLQRIPQGQVTPDMLKAQIGRQIATQGLSSLTDEQKELYGIGPSANAQLSAQMAQYRAELENQAKQDKIDADKALTDEKLAAAKDKNDALTAQKAQEFQAKLDSDAAARQQRDKEFQQNQARMVQQASQIAGMKLQDLQLKLKALAIKQEASPSDKTSVASQRNAIAAEMADTARKRIELTGYQQQVQDNLKKVSLLEAQKKMIAQNDKDSSGMIGSIFGKSSTISKEGQAQIDAISEQERSLDAERADIVGKQSVIFDQLSATKSATPTNTPAAAGGNSSSNTATPALSALQALANGGKQ